MTYKQLIKEIKGVFKLPKKQYYLGKLNFGCPYMYPRNFNSSIITIRKDISKYNRCKYFKLFNRIIYYGWPIKVVWLELGWKDKYDTPRYEWSPAFYIYFFKWQFCIWWNAPIIDNEKYSNNDKYYQMILWYLKYSDKDIKKAEETWSWVDFETQVSTWNNNYLI